MKPTHKRTLLRLAVFGLLGAFVCVLAARHLVLSTSRDRVYTELTTGIRPANAALVLGCAKTPPDGRGNLYFKYRVAAAAELYHAGLVRHLIVSGDNSRKDYDEPTDMKNALVARGIPAERIHCDYAGFRTLDSVVRAREIFQQERIIVVSQEFHAQRAVYLARHHGIDAIGFAAQDVTSPAGLRTRLRENLARVKAVLDVHILRTSPKFLGAPIPLDA